MLYLDTSLLVAAFTHEATTDRAWTLLKRSRSEPLLVSEWVSTEFAAAMSRKLRMREIEDAYHSEAMVLFAKQVSDSMEVATVTTAHFKEATRFAAELRLGLRAGDALHVAIAAERNATLVTLDKRMAAAAKTLGIPSRLL